MRFVLAALVGSLAAAPLHQDVEGGWIDWGRGVLVASATSSAGAGPFTSRRTLEQEAWLLLEARLEEQARAVLITSVVRAGDLMSGQDPQALRLQEGLKTWRVTTTRYHRSGQVELEAELVLRDWLRPALLAWGDGGSEEAATSEATGVVVDARGLEVTPVILPRLVDEDLELIFGPEHIRAAAVVEGAPSVWVTDPSEPLAVAQAGPRPLVIRATNVSQSSDLVIGEEVVSPLLAQRALLGSGHLVLVVDP